MRPDHVAVFGGDHIYLFDVSQMDDHHRQTNADLTVAAVPVPIAGASDFGILVVDEAGRITGFEEKPANPTAMPGRPDMALVSMGNYIFKAKTLSEALLTEAGVAGTSYDFGGDVIPRLISEGASVQAYNFTSNVIRGAAPEATPYWRDVGTIDSYVQANAEARDRVPAFDLYNRSWRIRTAQRDYPPARFVLEGGEASTLMLDSLVCEGSIVANASLTASVIGYDCFVHNYADLDDTILLSGCSIGSGARLQRVLADKNCIIDQGAQIGVDLDSDRKRFPFVSPSGVVTLPKGARVPAEGPLELTPDMVFALQNDPATSDAMEQFADQIATDDSGRHSSDSAGPAQRA
ncbi:MAG: sugar phosphate nucleotidyltransferase [Acidimicrobiia bacterium]|nr:sugar phosphate nucleotidyltransferase [Acidimicrobiia bacterium]